MLFRRFYRMAGADTLFEPGSFGRERSSRILSGDAFGVHSAVAFFDHLFCGTCTNDEKAGLLNGMRQYVAKQFLDFKKIEKRIA